MNAVATLFQRHPSYQILAEAVAEAGLTPADPTTQGLDDARCRGEAYHRLLGGAPIPVARVIDHQIAGPHGAYRLRVYHPAYRTKLPFALHCHGGGYALNGIETHDAVLRRLAKESGVAICSLGYSKAPEARYPIQLNEARHALDWLGLNGAELGLDPSRIVLSGDSAGAHLALTTALARRDAGQSDLRGLVLAYGMFEPAFDSSSHRAFGQGYGLTSERMRWFWDHFLPAGQNPREPLVAPLWGDLAGLPRTLVLAAELDCLKDDSLQLADRLDRAGVSNQLSIYKGMQHAFLMAPDWLPPARQAITDIADTIRDWLLAA